MVTNNQQLQQEVQIELENITLSVMSYNVAKIKKTMDSNEYLTKKGRDQLDFLRNELKTSLETMRDGKAFSPERTQEIINRYTPLSALNKDGAGHILFFDQHNPNTIHVAMRGSEEFLTDWLRSDTGNIAIGDVPMHQTSLIDNFIARETAPAATSVPKVKFDNQLRD